MKSKWGYVIIGILAFAIIILIIAIIKKKPTPNDNFGAGMFGGNGIFGGSGSGNGSNQSSSGNSGGAPAPTPTPQPSPQPSPAVKTLENLTGQPLTAKYSGTVLRYSSDLSVAKTYNAGDFIGYLGKENIGDYFCKNTPGYYRILTSGVDTFLGCPVVMDSYHLKQILGIA